MSPTSLPATSRAMMALLLFAVLGKITDGLLSALFAPLLRWQDVYAGGR